MIKHQKILITHLERAAMIYVRQSTMKQVLNHKESQLYQIKLNEKALELGWNKNDIHIIDSDLGMSGATSEGRKGFENIVSEISLSRVGIVFGYDVSRLARNCADWYKLIDLCSVFGTLIGDVDGIYNPGDYNDRLLLGLKGTMSEAELHILKNRMNAGKLNKAKRGDLIIPLPAGYLRDKYFGVIKDPDLQVQKTLELIFSQFQNLGSCNKLMKYFRKNNILIPRRAVSALNKGELIWKEVSNSALRKILHNPIYAGAFAYGRRQIVPGKKKPNQPNSGVEVKPEEEWISLVKDKYPAYITWEEYSRNQRKLKENANIYKEKSSSKGIERNGKALLQGIIYCGECGCKLKIYYKKTNHYYCFSMESSYAEKKCLSINVKFVDEAVEKAFFEAIGPFELDLLGGVIKKEEEERVKLFEYWEQRIKRLEYEEKIASKRYKAVDPENRLVASGLEREWEEKIRELITVKKEFEDLKLQKKRILLSPEMELELKSLSKNLPKLWHSEKLSNEQKKRLIRSLIDKVVVKRPNFSEIELRVVWVSGHYSLLNIDYPVRKTEDMKNYSEIVEIVKELTCRGLTEKEIALELNEMNYRTARLRTFTGLSVVRLKSNNNLFSRNIIKEILSEKYPGFLTTFEAAKLLKKTWQFIHSYIRKKIINPVKDEDTGIYIILPEHIKILKRI